MGCALNISHFFQFTASSSLTARGRSQADFDGNTAADNDDMAIFGLCDTLWSRTHDPVQYITLFGKELGVKIYATCGLFERYKEDSAGREMIPEPVLESDPAAEAEGAAKLLKTLTRLLSDVEAEGRRIAERKQATGQKGPDKIFYPGRKVDPQPP